ncbi:MAG: TnpV protein, partial [Eubacterium sp.]|nr:TnpV protein [Eubacterium sp.]
ILSGKLYSVLHDLDYQAQKRYELILCQMKTAEGITESLKAKNQLEWVGKITTS